MPGTGASQILKYRDFASGLHVKGKTIVEVLCSEPIREIVEALIGRDADMRFTSTMTKTKEKNHPLDWHQDAGYDRDPRHLKFSFWMALTDSGKENGGLRIIPGSHKPGLVKHITSRNMPPDLEIETVDEGSGIDLEVAAGDAVVLSPFVHHSSHPNVSGELRMALLAGFMRPKEKYHDFELKGSFTYLREGRISWERVKDRIPNADPESPRQADISQEEK